MKRIAALIIIFSFLLNMASPATKVNAFSSSVSLTAEEKATQLLAQLSPEEKVGQLFLVTFKGMDVSDTSQIYDLVVNKHVGGVVLLQSNDNFSGPENTLVSAQNLINSLQSANWTNVSDSTKFENLNPTYIPLFTAINQEGDGFPNDQILNGMTPLADEMSIGATWQTSSAESTGKILGQELKAIGFNLFLGPSLDVSDSVGIVNSEDLGVRVFGGDPYWVAEMGKAYIKGIHEGSQNQVAVIAKNFPGRGSADRRAEDEVATVRKSLEQLKQIELAPFFAVTSPSTESIEQADGLLVSHIRYQGFQGNIRATTRPISLDSTALEQILTLSEFSGWRDSGGIIVSDDLGTDSIKKFFDPTGTAFDARQVVKNAFMAGNDLLFMGDLISSGDQDNYATINRCLDYFLQKYREDSAFAQKVDDSVKRLLTIKFKLYPDFTLTSAVQNKQLLSQVGEAQQTTFQIASAAVTLISPDLDEVDSVLPNSPQISDQIVFISDLVTQKQCSTCESSVSFSADELRKAVISLYGSTASEQIKDYQLSAYSFDDLKNLLDQTGDSIQLQNDLASADWIVFSFLGDSETGIGQQVLTRFLSERTSLIRDKHIIGFAFNAPYYLDATDISKLTAYYGIYGKSTPFIEVAARVLFQEIIPQGKLPVSVSGVGYDLITATTPDPNQIIQLVVDNGDGQITQEPTSLSTPTPKIYNVGDNLAVMTGIIQDHNGNPVPDGTVVRFMIDLGSSSGSVETTETVTVDGVARSKYRIPSTGTLELSVQAEPALISQTLKLEITDKGGILTAHEPTVLPTDTIVPKPGEPEQVNIPSTTQQTHEQGFPTPGDWLLSSILILGLSAAIYWIGSNRINLKWAIRWAIIACLSGYLAYIYLAAGLPGSGPLISRAGTAAIALTSAGGVVFGWAVSGIWWFITKRQGSMNQ